MCNKPLLNIIGPSFLEIVVLFFFSFSLGGRERILTCCPVEGLCGVCCCHVIVM